MSDERKALTSRDEILAALLAKLDAVMADAERLRAQVTRQLADQRSSQMQQVTPAGTRKKRSRRR